MALPPQEIGKRIREVREQVSVSTQQIAEALGVGQETVHLFEKGQLDPIPGDYILIISRLLETDFRYFISTELDAVESGTRQVFRAMTDPRPRDVLAIRRFVSFCMSESELEVLLEADRPSLPPQYPLASESRLLHKDQGRLAASHERARLKMGIQPVQNVFRLIRLQGVRVFRNRLDDAELSGVTVLHPLAGVCVLVNYEEDLYRQFFSAAQEYAHVLFDREEISRSGCVVSYKYSKEQLVELRANRFAAEFLLPVDAFKQYSRPKANDANALLPLIGEIARTYRVNTATVVRQMREAGWISDRTVSSFFKTRPVAIPRREKIDPEIPSNLSERQEHRWKVAMETGVSTYYLELLRRARTEEQISWGRFAEMLGLSVEAAQDFVRDTGLAV